MVVLRMRLCVKLQQNVLGTALRCAVVMSNPSVCTGTTFESHTRETGERVTETRHFLQQKDSSPSQQCLATHKMAPR